MKRKTFTLSRKNLTQTKKGVWRLRKKIDGTEIYRVLKATGGSINRIPEAVTNEALDILAKASLGLAEALEATKNRKSKCCTVGDIVSRYRNSAQAKQLKGKAVEANINCFLHILAEVYEVEVEMNGKQVTNLSGAHKADAIREEYFKNKPATIINGNVIDTLKAKRLEAGVTYMSYEKVPVHVKRKQGLNPVEQQRILRWLDSKLKKARSLFATSGKVVKNLMSDDPDVGIYTDIKIPQEVWGFIKKSTDQLEQKYYIAPDRRAVQKILNSLTSGELKSKMPGVYIAFKIVYCCGARIGEIKHLMWEQIKHESNGIWIYFGINESSSGTKNRKQRKVELPESLYNELCEMDLDEDYICGSDFHYRDRQLERDFSKWMRSTGWTRHQCAHEIRKLFGCNLAEHTNNLESVAKVLGHSNIKTTYNYYHDKINKVDTPDFNNKDLPSPKVKIEKVA